MRGRGASARGSGREERRVGRSTRGAPSGARHRENKQSKSAGGSDARRDRRHDARAGIDARIRLGSLPRGASRARGRHRGGGRAGHARRAELPRGDARVHRRPYYSGHPARRQSGFPREGERAKGSGSLAREIAGASVDARKVFRGSCACRGRRYSSARARVCGPPQRGQRGFSSSAAAARGVRGQIKPGESSLPAFEISDTMG